LSRRVANELAPESREVAPGSAAALAELVRVEHTELHEPLPYRTGQHLFGLFRLRRCAL
jgi:hypothetical protein